MTLTAANVGGWALNEILTSAQMNHLQAELLKAVDGAGGGSYTLSAPLEFDGDEVTFGAGARVLAGSTLFVEDLLSMSSGADADFNSGSTLSIEAGAAANIAGDFNMLAGSNALFSDIATLDVDDDVVTYSLALSAAYIEEDGAGEDTWTLTRNEAPGNWLQHSIAPASGAQVFFPFRVNGGDDINSIEVTLIGGIDGGHGALPAVMPEITLVECHFITPAVDLCTVTDPSASVGVYDAAHTVVLSNATTGGVLPYLAQSGGYYLIRINGEASTNAEVDELTIMRINVGIIVRSLVPTSIK